MGAEIFEADDFDEPAAVEDFHRLRLNACEEDANAVALHFFDGDLERVKGGCVDGWDMTQPEDDDPRFAAMAAEGGLRVFPRPRRRADLRSGRGRLLGDAFAAKQWPAGPRSRSPAVSSFTFEICSMWRTKRTTAMTNPPPPQQSGRRRLSERRCRPARQSPTAIRARIHRTCPTRPCARRPP